MGKQELVAEILALSPDERMDVIEAVWDSLAAAPEALPLHDWQKEELDRRLKEHEADPDGGVPWEEALERIRRGR